jgi:amidohydrolase
LATTTLQTAKQIEPFLLEIRREIHRHAELSFQEHWTADFISAKLREIGLSPKRIAGTGVVAVLEGNKPGPAIGLRADIDALPIQEESGAPYSSVNKGVMHACAHDAHTTIVLGAATLLCQKRDQLSGKVKFVFQPAEETPPGGAIKTIEEGALENPKVDAMIALHHAIELPVGTIGIHYGQLMASADFFKIILKTKGGGGSAPHRGVDGIVFAGLAISALQTISSRMVDPLDPFVLSMGTIHGGVKNNVLADRVEITGTTRALSPELRNRIPDMMRTILDGVAVSQRGEYELQYERGYPPLVNNDSMVDLVKQAGEEVIGPKSVIKVPPIMAADDLAYFLEKVPGAYFWLGVSNRDNGIIAPAHSSKFNIDENSLAIGTAIMARTAEHYLAAKPAK